MMGQVVAIPNCKGGFADFWKFEKDNGQPLPAYGVRIAWTPSTKARTLDILKRAKADYLKDIEQLRKDARDRAVACESTKAIRDAYREYFNAIEFAKNNKQDKTL